LDRLADLTEGINSVADLIGVLPMSIADGLAGIVGLAIEQYRALTPTEEFLSGGVPQFAAGGSHSGGWRVVGEQGPELEYTGPPQVYSNSQSLFDPAPIVDAVSRVEKRLAKIEQDNLRIAGRAEEQRSDQIAETGGVKRAIKSPIT